MAMDRVGGVAGPRDIQKSENDGANAVLVKRGQPSSVKLVDGASNAKFDGILEKVQKKGEMSLKQFSDLAKMTDGGKEALATFLKDNGIMPAKTVDSLKSKDLNFADKFVNFFGSGKLGIAAKVAFSIVTAGIGAVGMGVAYAARNETISGNKLEQTEGKQNLKETIKTGSTKLIQDMKNCESLADLKKFVQDNKISAKEYDALSKHIPFAIQTQMDKEMMVETLKNPGNPEKAATLQKIFHLMQNGGTEMRVEGSKELKPFPHDLASALSHGGRVCMVVDKDQVDAIEKFIKGSNNNERKALKVISAPSSHGINHSKNDTGLGFSEAKFGALKAVTGSTSNWGINLAVGGAGSENIWGAKRSDDGTFGHLLVAIDKSKEPAVIMIGIENSQPGKSNQFGGSHDIDCHAGDTSPQGGTKWKNMTDVPGGKPAGLGGIVVDLRGGKSAELMKSFPDSKLTPEQLVGPALHQPEPKGILEVPELVVNPLAKPNAFHVDDSKDTVVLNPLYRHPDPTKL